MNATTAVPFVHDVEVRFHDLDAMGHVHHSLPLIYFEEARASFWRDVTGRDDVAGIDYVLGEVNVRYHGRILYPGGLRVELWVTRIGTASFQLGYEIRDARRERVVTGSSTQVMFDYEAGRSKPIPDDVRKRLSGFSR